MTLHNLNRAQYYRSFYSGYETARNEDQRSALSKGSLVQADSSALKKAAKTFSTLYSSENLSGKDILQAILAFGDTYNNALESSSDTGVTRVSQLSKKLKSLSSKQKKDMAEIGISVKQSGKLSIDKEKLSSASANKVKKIFGNDSEFLKELKKYASSLKGESSTIDLQA